jgi:hypothetical protein
MPFLHTVLGYDVFNPNEVIPEFTADIATKKGEKVDYALVKYGEVQILIECKKCGENYLCHKFPSAILTNGTEYQFFTDLDALNKMDEKPFSTLELQNIEEHFVPELKN